VVDERLPAYGSTDTRRQQVEESLLKRKNVENNNNTEYDVQPLVGAPFLNLLH
jgi:hypothetical protein